MECYLLHLHGIFHEDMKAINVILSLGGFENSSMNLENLDYYIAAFWRAPQILYSSKDKGKKITF